MDGLLESRWKMDPNATLEGIRVVAARMEDFDSEGLVEDAIELATLVQNLDEWLSKGGFPPEAWRHAR